MLIALFLCILFGGGIAFVLGIISRMRKTEEGPQPQHTIQRECTVCHRELVFNTAELVPLSPVEMALCVRSKPSITGRKLAEYVCPYCEASHCFAVDGSPPEWVGANFYQPQGVVGHCCECKQHLRNPNWTPGTYDHRLNEVPDLAPDHGLVCSRCGANCCVDCCRKYTMCRFEKAGDEYLCPRCGRGPIDTFYHP